MALQSIIQWDSQEEAQEFFHRTIGEARVCMKESEAAAEENVEELAIMCRTELLDLLQKIAGRKIKNTSLQAIIAAKIASLEETTSVLRAEIRAQIEKSGSHERWKEGDMTNNLIHQFVKAFTKKSWLQTSTSLAKGIISHSRKPSSKEKRVSISALSTPTGASSGRGVLWGGFSRSKTPTPSIHSIDQPISETPSSQQSLLLVSEPEPAAPINEIITTRAGEFIVGGSFTLGALTEASDLPSPVLGPDVDCQVICASSAKLGAYISTNVIDPFLQSVRSKMTHLADARIHHMEKVYEKTILGVIAEYEEAIKKEEDQRQRTPEDQRVRSTLAQLQLWVNVTAAVSAIDALTKAREDSLQKPTDLGSPILSPLSL